MTRLVLLLVASVLLGLWVVVLAFTNAERGLVLERAREQLQATTITLADFHVLAEQVALSAVGSDARTDALWRALLQYPSASIWIETDGEPAAGLPPSDLTDSILVQETRGAVVVHAALPEAEALRGWRGDRQRRVLTLGIATFIVLAMTVLLMQALRRRAEAERAAAVSEERNLQLLRYGAELEHTVEERTAQLATANVRLGEELQERKAAEKTLREHDALLSSVASSAAELLGTHNSDEAISAVLEAVGRTIGVSRVQLIRLEQASDGRVYGVLANEWCAPGLDSFLGDHRYQQVDMDREYPRQFRTTQAQGLLSFHIDELEPVWRQRYLDADMRTLLHVPVALAGQPWGALRFIDSGVQRRQWSWAETDTLRTLAGLIGVAMTRARFVKELADANTIVQNSPTILYRIEGQPPFRLMYVSHNITKYGHRAEDLVGTPDWIGQLVVEDDRVLLRETMARLLGNGPQEAATLELRLRTGDDACRWVENRYTPVRDVDGRLLEVEGIIIDVTERKAAEEKIAALARTDALTGLANRVTFNERLAQAFVATRRGGKPFAVFYMDLDRFKTVNDTLGHAVGDELLRETARRLTGSTRETDLVARLGGDEFAILQMDITDASNAGTLAQTIQQALAQPLQLQGHDLQITCSIGICPWAEDIADPDAMLVQADLALYRAKEEGRNCFRFHSAALDEEVNLRNLLADELRAGLECGELELAWQPQVAVADARIVSMEALLRWRHPQRGLLVAQEFVPVAEKTGLIMALGRWVLDAACAQLQAWRSAGAALGSVTVNLSQIQLRNGSELLQDVQACTARHGLTPADLEFDVTEGMLAQATWTNNDVLQRLHGLGCKLAIDSFGTAYSSFEYLRAFEVDHLKLASRFVQEAVRDVRQAGIIRAILQLAQDLDVGVVVEGVETAEHSALVHSLYQTVDAQGYYYSPVVDAATASRLLLQDRHLPATDPAASAQGGAPC